MITTGLSGFALTVLGTLMISSGAWAADHAEQPHVKVHLVTESASVQPGQTLWAGAWFELEKGWHVYWMNAGDSGQPPRINWELPKGFEPGPILWPTPERLLAGPLVNYGYENQVLLMAPIQISAGAAGEVPLKAKLKWLVCQESCIPGRAELDLSIPVRTEAPGKSSRAHLFEETRRHLPEKIPSGWQVRAVPHAKTLELRISESSLKPDSSAFFFPAQAELIESSAPQKVSKTDLDAWWMTFQKSEQIQSLPERLQGVLVTDGKAYEIDAPFPAEPGPARGSFPQALFFALIGGLILNLMPCVFPVLSIKALSLFSMSKESPRGVRVHGYAYTLGILISFWVFAAAMLMLRSGGQALGWGFQMQSPAFLAILAELLFLMALNLLGVFEITLGAVGGAGGRWAAMPGYSGSFFTGVLATLVATPCTAPFMGTALGFAIGQPALQAIAIFTALGMGLALPYLALSLRPGWAKKLPRPGRWMESFRQFLAFPLLGTVIWLVWIFSLQAGTGAVAALLSSFLLLGLGAWIAGRWRSRASAVAFGALLIFAALVGARSGAQGNPVASPRQVSADGNVWLPFSETALEDALKQGKPVFVDFTAAWCVTCKVNERLALNRADVVSRMQELGVLMLQADWTNGNPAITRILGRFGRSGVPLYLLYSGREGEAPRVLPQILTSQEILSDLDRIQKGAIRQ